MRLYPCSALFPQPHRCMSCCATPPCSAPTLPALPCDTCPGPHRRPRWRFCCPRVSSAQSASSRRHGFAPPPALKGGGHGAGCAGPGSQRRHHHLRLHPLPFLPHLPPLRLPPAAGAGQHGVLRRPSAASHPLLHHRLQRPPASGLPRLQVGNAQDCLPARRAPFGLWLWWRTALGSELVASSWVGRAPPSRLVWRTRWGACLGPVRDSGQVTRLGRGVAGRAACCRSAAC
jgi:hypothetical protein